MTNDEQMPELHRLKIDPRPMDDLLSGAKTGEVRKDDRVFRVGDHVLLTCADGREAGYEISHIQRGYSLPDGLCVLSYRADLCASGKRVRAVLEGAVNWLDALLTLVQETSCDPDDPEAFDEVVMAAGMWLSSARAEIERLDRATRRAAAHDASPAVTDKEKEDDDRF